MARSEGPRHESEPVLRGSGQRAGARAAAHGARQKRGPIQGPAGEQGINHNQSLFFCLFVFFKNEFYARIIKSKKNTW